MRFTGITLPDEKRVDIARVPSSSSTLNRVLGKDSLTIPDTSKDP